jgi:hypothetical protein
MTYPETEEEIDALYAVQPPSARNYSLLVPNLWLVRSSMAKRLSMLDSILQYDGALVDAKVQYVFPGTNVGATPLKLAVEFRDLEYVRHLVARKATVDAECVNKAFPDAALIQALLPGLENKAGSLVDVERVSAFSHPTCLQILQDFGFLDEEERGELLLDLEEGRRGLGTLQNAKKVLRGLGAERVNTIMNLVGTVVDTDKVAFLDHCLRQSEAFISPTTIERVVHAAHVPSLKFILEKGADTVLFDDTLLIKVVAAEVPRAVVPEMIQAVLDDFRTRGPLPWFEDLQAYIDFVDFLGISDGRPEPGAAVLVPGKTALYASASSGNEDAVRILLEAGADPNVGTTWTPLYTAAFRGHLSIVQMLLDAGADVHGTYVNTVLAEVMKAPAVSWDVVTALLTAGADPAHNSAEDVFQIATTFGGPDRAQQLRGIHQWVGIRSIFVGATARAQMRFRGGGGGGEGAGAGAGRPFQRRRMT